MATRRVCNAVDCNNFVFSNGYCKLHQYLNVKAKVNQWKKVAPIKVMGAILRKKIAEYRLLREDFLKEFPLCLAKLTDCTRIATDIHHRKGRGKFLLDVETWLPVCRNCHRWIEGHPKEAKQMGFSRTRLFDNDDFTDNPGPPINFTP